MVKKEEKQKPEEVEEEYEKDIADVLEQITPFVEALAPRIVDLQKAREPLIKRNQIINFIVMMTILVSVVILAYNNIIDGSAATGLIGAIIGYVFGGLYQQKNK
ncbi:MAG: hypothetical protein ACTSX6_00640 [Candidatus Heimdallarchaeaceae archaeon]